MFAAPAPSMRPYVDSRLGTFNFDASIGWKQTYRIDGRDVEIVIGSDGETPSADMASTAADWVLHWNELRPGVTAYIEAELSVLQADWYPTSVNRLVLSSINVLWPESPTTAMLYFDDLNDDTRSWHATYEGRQPKGFAFDD